MQNSSSGADGGWDGGDQTISRQFDWHETPPSVAVVRLLSVATNSDPTVIEPLGTTVDPDALDRLMASMDDGSQVAFTHSGTTVRLYGDGSAAVDPGSR